MRLEGRIWRDGRHWLVEVPMLDLMTQGRTRPEALTMIADAIESLVDSKGFAVDVHLREGEHIEVGSRDVATLVALLLRRQREKHGLSLADVAARMGQRSRNAYARYERGTSVPTVDKLEELLAAVAPGRDLVLREAS
jgi:predicted RNase H-like HicB family nuclease